MKKDEPIGVGLAIALVGFGLFIDFIQFVLGLLIIGEFLDSAIDVFAGIVFTFMLSHHGGKILSRRMVSLVTTAIAEFIPIVNLLPLWTLFAIYTIVMDKVRHSSFRQEENPAPRRKGGGGFRL
jgi:hypothetical protein